LWSPASQFDCFQGCYALMSSSYRSEDTNMMKETEVTTESEMAPDNSTLYVGLGGYVTATSVLAGLSARFA
ncbi:hypothetical protein, partial [Pseudomonas aeruginosa]